MENQTIDDLNRLKEETTFQLISLLKASRQGIGTLTLLELAIAIKEGLGDDSRAVAILLVEATKLKVQKINYFEGVNKKINEILGC
jgi:hypothetical protein